MNSGLAVDLNGDGTIDVNINPQIPFSHIMEEHKLPDSTGIAISYTAKVKTKVRKPFFLWFSDYQPSDFCGIVNISISSIDGLGEREITVNIEREVLFIDARSNHKVYKRKGISFDPKTRETLQPLELVKNFTLVIGELHG